METVDVNIAVVFSFCNCIFINGETKYIIDHIKNMAACRVFTVTLSEPKLDFILATRSLTLIFNIRFGG